MSRTKKVQKTISDESIKRFSELLIKSKKSELTRVETRELIELQYEIDTFTLSVLAAPFL
jgi:hypothetical protein